MFEAKAGIFLCDALLKHGVELEHACEKACACSTCHVLIREGLESLTPASAEEEDRLDHAWGLEAQSRLSCQVVIRHQNLVIELPRYSLNLTRERA